MNELFKKFQNTLVADYKKLTIQKYILTFLIIFIALGAIFSFAVMILDYKYDNFTDPTSTFSTIHTFLLQFTLVITIIFAGSVNICREFENSVIKNIVLTGISITHYLFARLLLFIIIFSVISFAVLAVDTLLFLAYFKSSFNYTTMFNQYPITILHLLNTVFLVVTFSAISRVTIFPVLFSLIYYFFIEYFLIGIIKNFGPSLPKLKILVTMAGHSPLQLIEKIESAVGAGDVIIYLLSFFVYLVLYASIIWATTRNAQLGLLNKN